MSAIITLTEAAALQIQDMMKQNGEENAYFRFSINGGGCSGLSYGMSLEHEKAESDQYFEQNGIHVVIDEESAPLLTGTVIDYKQSLMGGGFTIDNPNALVSCGCGSSFRTAKVEGNPEKC
ncbi:HesB/IscA family protein [Lederbergia citrea]|uniref:Iron-sulfur cluster assembly accessory protein n=1 Tax=Lederbergia citrea TaxID=2833581 RepID=A0A942UK10_9BACI|nr:iron-sulfur cluster assembly accessory protein [Lederbergia citrea]MBS4178560.1 iron-sulfur cluster assembly accessory protein [Lederbergia citrea]MBS4205248.1 iron-sulfur cluster assembly accessory protein [Lederbergia citrea]MBS4222891.1 iron-sulfur cluster assembly accessory protein [Lederbergia citrea]